MMKKRITAFLLASCLGVSMLSTTIANVFATTNDRTDNGLVDKSGLINLKDLLEEKARREDEARWEQTWERYYAEHPEELEGIINPQLETPLATQTFTRLTEMYARAEAIVNYKWTPSSNIQTWNSSNYNGKTYFPAGSTVTGVPYTLFTYEVVSGGSLCSLSQYKAVAAKNYSATAYCNSVDARRTGPVYGSCCADLVSEVFGGSFMNGNSPRYHSVSGIWNSSYGTTLHNKKWSDIRAGDALSDENHQHIIWVGAISDTSIVIYEQTPPVAVKKTLNKSSCTNSAGYFIYNGVPYSAITRSNAFLDDSKPSKPVLKTEAKTTTGAGTKLLQTVFHFNSVTNATKYHLFIEKKNKNGAWKSMNPIQNVGNGQVQTFDDGSYRARLQAVNTNYRLADGNNPSIYSDYVNFTVGFTDIYDSDSYYNAVMWAERNGNAAGDGNGHFNPTGIVTRAEAVTFLWAYHGKPQPKSTANPFVDVKKGDWYHDAVLWAKENGITAGTDATHFSPTATCTRSQILLFLYASVNRPSYSISNPYSDVQNDWYKDSAIWAYQKGLEKGENGKFNPGVACTRANMVMYLYRLKTGKELAK